MKIALIRRSISARSTASAAGVKTCSVMPGSGTYSVFQRKPAGTWGRYQSSRQENASNGNPEPPLQSERRLQCGNPCHLESIRGNFKTEAGAVAVRAQFPATT